MGKINRRKKKNEDNVNVRRANLIRGVPTITRIVPEIVQSKGDFYIAIFGNNFVATSELRARLTILLPSPSTTPSKPILNNRNTNKPVLSSPPSCNKSVFLNGIDIEYHSITSLLVHFDWNLSDFNDFSFSSPSCFGEISVSVDSGKSWGSPSSVIVVNSDSGHHFPRDFDRSVDFELTNVKRTISRIEADVSVVKKAEQELSKRFGASTGYTGLLDKNKELSESLSDEEEDEEKEDDEEEQKGQEEGEEKEGRKVLEESGERAPNGDLLFDDPSKELFLKLVGKEGRKRELRIFISSPFKGMRLERDVIIKRVFPGLKKQCMQRDISFSYVDFRWGVTEAANQGGTTLQLCLQEIQKSDILIGLYGERYGWCLSKAAQRNPTESDNLLMRTFNSASKDFPWVLPFRDRSVTEVEMRSVLDGHFPIESAFYFRDPYFAVDNQLPPGENLEDYSSEGEFCLTKLNSLKKDVCASKFTSRLYRHPDHFQEIVSSDLQTFLNANFPPTSSLSENESERFRHEQYANVLKKPYIPFEKEMVMLDRFTAESTTSPAVVCGDTGTGKSALLANWATSYGEHHPEDLVVTHFIGVTASSTLFPKILRRITDEIEFHLKDHSSNRMTDEILVERFNDWLLDILERNKQHRLVLIIDGFDGLDPQENSLELVWLPSCFPERVRVILSTTPDSPCHDVLVNRRPHSVLINLGDIDEPQRINFIRQYLNLGSKKMSQKQEFTIAACNATARPRFLKTLLDYTITWGSFEDLDSSLSSYLGAVSVADLYQFGFDKIEVDWDTHRKGILKTILTSLAGARRGLYLDELEEIMGRNNIEQEEWSPMLFALEDYLLDSGGMLHLANSDVKRAITQRFMTTEEEARGTHLELSKFFRDCVDIKEERRAEELPWQLMLADAVQDLKTCLSDLRLFFWLSSKENKYDLAMYWRVVEEHTDYTCQDCYLYSLQGGQFPPDQNTGDVFYSVGYFLEDIGRLEGAGKIYLNARSYYESASQNLEVAKIDLSAARVLLLQARYSEAEEMLKRALDMYTRELGAESAECSHVKNRMGALYTETNQYAEAERMFLDALEIRERVYGPQHSRPAQTLKHMLTLYETQNLLEKADEVGSKALSMTEKSMGPNDVNVGAILCRMARVHMARKKFKEAKKALKRALSIYEKKYGPNHPRTADVVYEMGCYYFVKPETLGNLSKSWSQDKAESFFERALKIKEESLGKEHPEVSRVLNRMGSLAIEKVEFEMGLQYLTRALKIREAAYGRDHSRVAQTLKHLLTLYELQERFKDALNCGKRALRITEKIFGAESQKVANICIRVAQLLFFTDGLNSYEGKKFISRATKILEKRCGPDSAEVVNVKKMIEELEKTPEEMVKEKKSDQAAPQPEPEPQVSVTIDSFSPSPQVVRAEPVITLGGDGIPLPPPPPPPMVAKVPAFTASFVPPPPPPPLGKKGIPPPPPPPPGKGQQRRSLSISPLPPPPPQPVKQKDLLLDVVRQAEEVRKRQTENQRKERRMKSRANVRGDWWKQNYKFGEKAQVKEDMQAKLMAF